MKKYIIVSICSLLIAGGCASAPRSVRLSAPESPAIQIPEELRPPSGEKKLVSVVGVENKSIYRAENLWDVASDLLTTRIVDIGYFRVTDWQKIKNSFDHLSLQNASLVSSPDRFVKVRNELSCDYFLGGSVTFYDVTQTGQVSAISKNKTITTTIRVDLWLQDSQTGEYLSAASGNGRAEQQYSGGLLGGTVGTWDANAANKALTLAIDDGLVRLLKTYQEREKQRPLSTAEYARIQPVPAPSATYNPPPPLPSVPVPQPGDSQTGPVSAYKPGQPQPSGPPVFIPNRSINLPTSSFQRKCNKWAIIVGIGQFMDRHINRLDYTGKDAMAVYNYLIDPDYGRFMKEQVFLMIDENATTFNIKVALDLISKYSKPEDMVVIFLSTHGTPGDMDVEGVGYLITYDTLVDSLYATAFNMSELVEAVNKRIKAESVVTLADACYSAGSFKDMNFLKLKGAKDLVVQSELQKIPKEMIKGSLEKEGLGMPADTVRNLSSGTGRVFITSSRADEKSWESDTLGHGFFTYFLIDALKKNNGMISIQEVFDYLEKELPKAVMNEKGKPQHPVLGITEIKGDIILGVNPKIEQ